MAGNTQSHSLFYMRFWNPQFEQGLRRIYPSVASYPKTPFNAFRWSILLLRQQIQAGFAPSPLSQTIDVPVRPWVAYRSYSHGSVVNGSDYYQEALLHYIATGAADFNFWNPHEVPDLGAEDNRIFGRTLLEASSVLGCAGRRWSFPAHRPEATATAAVFAAAAASATAAPTTSGGGDGSLYAGQSSMPSLDRPLVLTGMSHVGVDGSMTRFRVTTANGAAQKFRTGIAPLVYTVPPSAVDGGGAALACSLTFSPAARVLGPALSPAVAPLGEWVEQPDNAGAPVIRCTKSS